MSTANTERAAAALLAMQRHSWEQGLAMQAFLERGDSDTLCLLAYEAVTRQTKDGRAAVIGVTDAITDPCSVGEGLLAAYRHTGDRQLGGAFDSLLDWALNKAPRSESGVLYHLTTGCEFWVDSMYMLPPFLACAGHYSESLLNLYGYWDKLFDEKASLMSHKWDDSGKRLSSAAHWGVGNGWAAASLARMYSLLPDTFEADRKKIAAMAGRLIDSLLAHVRGDWLFHNVVDDASSFVETNLSQQTAYSIYRGMCSGWLSDSYAEAASKLRCAAASKLDAYGFVQGVCGAPGFDSPGTAPEGQAFFLLMEQAANAFEAGRAATKAQRR